MSFSGSAKVAEEGGTSKGGWAQLWGEVFLCSKLSDSFGAVQILEATELLLMALEAGLREARDDIGINGR